VSEGAGVSRLGLRLGASAVVVFVVALVGIAHAVDLMNDHPTAPAPPNEQREMIVLVAASLGLLVCAVVLLAGAVVAEVVRDAQLRRANLANAAGEVPEPSAAPDDPNVDADPAPEQIIQ